jgi:peptidoglycan/LPS O-acetylase OafA/YrhL
VKPQSSELSAAADVARNDRVLPLTRIVAAAVVVILIVAVFALYLNPDQTDQNFAWTIRPRMMPMMMGAGYLMGAYFFARVLTAHRWHRVAAGFLPITVFTIFMASATILHADRFHQSQFAAALWMVIYAITPFLVPFLWWRNQRSDSGVAEQDDLAVPQAARWAALAAGVIVSLIGVVIFIRPDLAIQVWPWMLTPLTARVLAGWMMLPGMGGLYLQRESRWSAWCLLVESITVGSVFFGVAMIASWSDWSPSNPLTVLIALTVVLVVLLVPAAYFVVESRRRRMAGARQ